MAGRHLAGPQQGAAAQEHTLFFIDASGCAPRPRVVRPAAPVGQTPLVRAWWPRAHRSASSAISPAGQLYFHSQDHPLNADDVVGFLAQLRREVPGRMVLVWDGAPIQRRPVVRDCLAHGAAQRWHRERLPAYAPELNPGAGLWQPLNGVALRPVCGFNMPHVRRA